MCLYIRLQQRRVCEGLVTVCFYSAAFNIENNVRLWKYRLQDNFNLANFPLKQLLLRHKLLFLVIIQTRAAVCAVYNEFITKL